MSDLILSGLIALLIGAVGLLSYFLGKRAERNANFEEKKKNDGSGSPCSRHS